MATQMEKVAEVDNTQCQTCLYGANIKYDVFNCLYLLLKGHSRGCEPSPNCTEYKPFNEVERRILERNTSNF